jgi:hypothetical protein
MTRTTDDNPGQTIGEILASLQNLKKSILALETAIADRLKANHDLPELAWINLSVLLAAMRGFRAIVDTCLESAGRIPTHPWGAEGC